MNKKNLGELLLEYGMINEEDIKKALDIQKNKGVRIGEALIELGKVTEYDIEYILSVQLGIPYVLIDDLTIDVKLLKKFPANFLMENRILPIYETDDEISIVTDDPFNEDSFEKIKSLSGKEIKLSCGEGSKILEVLKKLLCQSEGIPIVTEIENIIEGIRETSFIRLDFFISNDEVSIGIFGNGKHEIKKILNIEVEREDIFKSFETLKIPFYYEFFENIKNQFLTIYPVLSENEPEYPCNVNKFGLVKINSVHFSDLRSHMIENAFYSDKIIYGYPYIAFKNNDIDYKFAVCVTCQGE